VLVTTRRSDEVSAFEFFRAGAPPAVPFDDVEENGLYTSSRGQISAHIGAKKLGFNLTILPPGKVQCPFHCHHGEEDMFWSREAAI
jgi:uncharacterized cupin superfamily protein